VRVSGLCRPDDDADLPDIAPEPPQFASDEEAAAWVKANLPAVADKVARLEGGAS